MGYSYSSRAAIASGFILASLLEGTFGMNGKWSNEMSA